MVKLILYSIDGLKVRVRDVSQRQVYQIYLIAMSLRDILTRIVEIVKIA